MRRSLSIIISSGLMFNLCGCSEKSSHSRQIVASQSSTDNGINPNIRVGDMSAEDAAIVTPWINEAVALMKSPEFETNFRLASQRYPELFVSRKEDLVRSETVFARLKTVDPRRSALWWPKSFVVLTGKAAVRSPNRSGFGFETSRKAGAGPMRGTQDIGEIELGRLHVARYARGDTVEKSCALNTMVHEISHTLSERPNEFWMHILDSEKNVNAPAGVFEASYFIGSIAQCTYLQNMERIGPDGFHACLLTFSDPASGSRFKSKACDDFPGTKPITPDGRVTL